MKKVTFFYIDGCPYCKQAEKALTELIAENPEYAEVEFERIDEIAHPEIADEYDYMATPCMFIGQEKIYESHFGEKAEEAKENVRRVLDSALSA